MERIPTPLEKEQFNGKLQKVKVYGAYQDQNGLFHQYDFDTFVEGGPMVLKNVKAVAKAYLEGNLQKYPNYFALSTHYYSVDGVAKHSGAGKPLSDRSLTELLLIASSQLNVPQDDLIQHSKDDLIQLIKNKENEGMEKAEAEVVEIKKKASKKVSKKAQPESIPNVSEEIPDELA